MVKKRKKVFRSVSPNFSSNMTETKQVSKGLLKNNNFLFFRLLALFSLIQSITRGLFDLDRKILCIRPIFHEFWPDIR